MDEELIKINVTLSNDQKQKIHNAFINFRDIRLRLSRKNNLRGCDTLIVPPKLFKKLDNASNGMEFHLKYSLYDTLPLSHKISVFRNIVNISENL